MKRFATTFALAAGLVTGAAFLGATKADDKKADKAPAAKADPKADKKGDAIARLATAHELIVIAREMKSAEGLVTAARIIWDNPVNDKPDTTKEGAMKGDPATLKVPADAPSEKISIGELLDEAAGYAGDDKVLAAMVAKAKKDLAERKRGEIDGPATHTAYVAANSTATWTGVFVSGSRAVVTVASTCGAPLDVSIYDGLGGSAHRTGNSNSTISWFPRETKTYTIKVINPTGRGVTYRLIHN